MLWRSEADVDSDEPQFSNDSSRGSGQDRSRRHWLSRGREVFSYVLPKETEKIQRSPRLQMLYIWKKAPLLWSASLFGPLRFFCKSTSLRRFRAKRGRCTGACLNGNYPPLPLEISSVAHRFRLVAKDEDVGKWRCIFLET